GPPPGAGAVAPPRGAAHNAVTLPREARMSAFQVGAIRVQVIEDGMLRLDPQRLLGGQPESAWRDEVELDDGGLVRVSVHCLVVRLGDKLAVLDTGLGLSPDSPNTPSIVGGRGRLMP